MDAQNENALLLLNLKLAVCETIADSAHRGTPSGHLYAALMHYGVDLDAYTVFMNRLVSDGLLEHQAHLHLYFITDKGKAFIQSNQPAIAAVNPEA